MSTRQKQLPFEGAKETARLERIRRIYDRPAEPVTPSRSFDEKAYHEATAIARSTLNQQEPNR